MSNAGNGLPQIQLAGTAGTFCDIERSSDLLSWAFWGRAVVGDVLSLDQLDPGWRTAGRGFFRVALASSQQGMPPGIMAQPAGTTANVGENASITVAATGSLPLQYQWQFNGGDIAGATAPRLVLTNLQPSQAGSYSVVITNAYGSATSNVAVLTVPPAPTVTSGSATGVTTTTATLNGMVNPNGFATAAQFEYGLTTAYGGTAEVTLSPDDGTSAQNVSAAISGLQGGRTYHCRLTAINAGGTTLGADMSFDTAVPPIDPGELVAPKIAIVGGNVEFTIQHSVSGRRYQLQQSDTMQPGSWVDVGVESSGDGNMLVIPIPYEAGVPRRFYRMALDPVPVPEGFALIPAGSFQMGDQWDERRQKSERPKR
jgi:hypothetical protein